MKPVESRITSKGQITVPAAVRERLELGPGTRIEWLEHEGEIVVRRASRFTSQEIHEAVFRTRKPAVSIEEMDQAIEARMRKKYAGR